jgi:hypothetical protein
VINVNTSYIGLPVAIHELASSRDTSPALPFLPFVYLSVCVCLCSRPELSLWHLLKLIGSGRQSHDVQQSLINDLLRLCR